MFRSSTHTNIRAPAYVLHPYGVPRSISCCVSIILTAYDALLIPLEAFPLPDYLLKRVTDWICTFYWTFDLFLNFRIGYYTGHGGSKLEMSPKKIAINYL